MIPFPDKKYDIIYADPPWHFNDDQLSANYQSMDYFQLCMLPIHKISNDNCLLFLWVVSPELDQGLIVGKSWGFDYKTVAFVWEKQARNPGNYTMSQCELCLVFKKGNIPQPRGKRNINQFLSVKRGKHSVKPLEVRDRITEMFPTQSKIELFARPSPLFKVLDDGWDAWGNEV